MEGSLLWTLDHEEEISATDIENLKPHPCIKVNPPIWSDQFKDNHKEIKGEITSIKSS